MYRCRKVALAVVTVSSLCFCDIFLLTADVCYYMLYDALGISLGVYLKRRLMITVL